MASPYKPVFADHINEFPNKNQMLMLVCKNRRQPEIKSSWEKHKVYMKDDQADLQMNLNLTGDVSFVSNSSRDVGVYSRRTNNCWLCC